MESLEAALQRLAAIAHELNNATEELNAEIERIDTTLGRMQLGVAVWLEESDGTPVLLATYDDPTRGGDGGLRVVKGYRIGYAKTHDGWHLAVQRTTWSVVAMLDDHPQHQARTTEPPREPIALLQAPREVRVEAIRHLLEVFAALQNRAERFAAETRTAKAAAEQLLPPQR